MSIEERAKSESKQVDIEALYRLTRERVNNAAEKGDIEALYSLIQERSDILKHIDEMEFVDTPLHIAAKKKSGDSTDHELAKQLTVFAMELMDLKPSYAKKLNGEGLSPMHLALLSWNTKLVLALLAFDKDLVRVKGKNGYTPFHYALTMENHVVLAEFLNMCPDCIHDVTNRNETAFHIAAKKNNVRAFEILLPWLWSPSGCSMEQIRGILNTVDNDGDTVLHIAASNNQPKIVRLLASYPVINLKATNANDLTALGILETSNKKDNKKCVCILRLAQRSRPLWLIPVFLVKVVSQLGYRVRHMSGDDNNALLVVTVLILTTTYQATLSPPGGVFPPPESNVLGNASTAALQLQIHHLLGSDQLINTTSNNNSTSYQYHGIEKKPMAAGSSVLDTTNFLWFFIPNIAAFSFSFIVTSFVLIAILPAFFAYTLVAALTTLLFCLIVSAVRIISPNSDCLHIMVRYVFILVYVLCSVMAAIIFVLLIKKLQLKLFLRRRMKTSSKRLTQELP